MWLGDIGTLGKQIPEYGSGQSNQIKGRIGLDFRVLGILERITILLTIRFLVLRKLVAHERTSLPHRRQTDLKCSPLEINDLHQASLGRNTLQHAAQILVQELAGGGDLHHIVAMEIIVSEGQRTLGLGQRKDHLGHKGRMMIGIRILRKEILQSSLTLFHDRSNHWNIRNLRPRKGFIARLTHILLKAGRIGPTITRLNLKGLCGACRGIRIILITRLFNDGMDFVHNHRSCGGCTSVNPFQLRNIIQKNVLFQLKNWTLTAGVLKLRSAGFTANPQLKGLANVGREPRTLRQIGLIIRNINHMLIGNSALHTLDLGKMRTPGFGQHHAGQSTHLGSRMRTLHLLLSLVRHALTLGQPQGSLVASHPMLGIQNARGLAMNLHRTLRGLNRVRVQNLLERLTKTNSLCTGSNVLEQELQWRQKGLGLAKSPDGFFFRGQLRTMEGTKNHRMGTQFFHHGLCRTLDKGMANFTLRKFNIEVIKERCEVDSRKSPMIVIIGKKDTGKSFLVRDILFHTQNCFPVGTVISGTEVANEFFQHMVPTRFIHDK